MFAVGNLAFGKDYPSKPNAKGRITALKTHKSKTRVQATPGLIKNNAEVAVNKSSIVISKSYLVANVYNTSSRLVSELIGIFGPGDDREGSKYPLPYGINRALGVPTAQASPSVTKDKQSPVWVDLAKDVIGLLREQTTTTPQPTTTQFSLLSQFQQV